MSEAPQPPSSGPTPPSSGRTPPDSGGSRNLWTYLALGAGVVVLAVVLFVLLRPDDSEPAAETTSEAQTTTQETTTEETTTEETTTEETTTEETTTNANQLQQVRVVFRNGEVVGGLVEADVEQGARVRLTVRADVTDEVHLHGYNLFADVAPGQPGRISFTADDPGEFEAELEALAIPVAELRVRP
jgi:FtsP/CotA-like multicopper oxidase with cupredoxin domain